MSSGIGRQQEKNTRTRMMQKRADDYNKGQGYTDQEYYEKFDNFLPEKEKPEKKKGIFHDVAQNHILPFEDEANVYLVMSNQIRFIQITEHIIWGLKGLIRFQVKKKSEISKC